MLLSPVSDQPSPPAALRAIDQKPEKLELGPTALEFGDAAGRLWTIVFEQIMASDALTMNDRGGSIPLVCREWQRLAELHFSIFPFPFGPAAALSTMLATVSNLEPDLTAPESNPRSGDKAVWFYTGKITHTRGPRTVARAVWRSTQAKSLAGATLVHCPYGLSLAVSAGRRRGVVAVLFGRDCVLGATAHPRPSVKWDGDILSFLFACSRFASSLEETWCDRFEASSILAAVTQAGRQVHSTQARKAVADLVERFATKTTMLSLQQNPNRFKPLLHRLPLLEGSPAEEAFANLAAAGGATGSPPIATEMCGLASEQVFLAGDRLSEADGPTLSFLAAGEFVVDWRSVGHSHVRKLQADYAEASRATPHSFTPPGSPGRSRRAHAFQSGRCGSIGSSPRLSMSGWSLQINMHGREQLNSNGRIDLEGDGGWQCILTWYKNFEKILFDGMIRDAKLLHGALWYFITVFEEIFDSKAMAASSEGSKDSKTTGRSGLEWMGQAASTTWGATLRSMATATAVRLTQAIAVDTLLRRDKDVRVWWQYALDRMVAVLAVSAAAQQDSPSRSRGGSGGSSPRVLTSSASEESLTVLVEEEQEQLLVEVRRSLAYE
eukprot:COSAG02_NODE_231_length_27944_cov_5.843347_11_plen_608_part_00